jgi:hypothetical protein
MIRSRLSVKCFQLLLATVVVSGVTAQESQSTARMGVPEDWTHHHVIFTADFLRAHPDIVARDPRALHQIYRRWGKLFSTNVVDLSETARKEPSGDWNVQLGAGTTAFGTSPAKYQTDPTQPPSCTTDFVVFGINAAGLQKVGNTNGQATVVAFNQLYTGPLGNGGICNHGPTYYFSYNTSTVTNGKIRTSPVISLDGTEIAFVESSANGSALHVLKIGTTGDNGGTIPNNKSVVDPVIPGTGNNAKLTTINYTTANNNHSSPWVDYSSDTLYVGDDNGTLYKVTGVFKGTPTLVSGGGWPVVIPGAFQLTGPVFDSTTGKVFAGDSRGFLHSVDATTPGTITNLAVGKSTSLNSTILDSPILDSNGNVFATSSNDGTSAVVVQADAATLTQKARVRIGEGSKSGTSVNLYDGDFDNNFYTSVNTGHYVLCSTGANSISPYRYILSISGGLLQTDNSPVQISTSTSSRCGPLTEFFNPNIGGGTDYFFWGVSNNCVGASGCIMELANGTKVKTVAATNGTSAVIIDNDSAASQASNIYFATQGGTQATRLATKVQQSTLQ